MKFALKAVAAVGLALTACDIVEKAATDQAEGPAAESPAAAEAAVQQRLPIMGTAVQSGDVDALVDLWAPDVRLYESGVVMDGEKQARQIMGQFLGMLNVQDLAITATETVAHDGGTVVYQFGYLTQTLKPSEGGPDIPVRNNFSLRWVPNADGVWEMHRYVSTAAPIEVPPPQPTTPARTALPALDAAAAESQVAQRTSEYQNALLSGDATRIASFFTNDAHFFEPELQQIGRAAIEQFIGGVTATHNVERLEMRPVETFVHDSGTVVYQYGAYTEETAEKATSRRGTTKNNYLVRWRRDADGTWRMDRFIATAQPDASRQF